MAIADPKCRPPVLLRLTIGLIHLGIDKAELVRQARGLTQLFDQIHS